MPNSSVRRAASAAALAAAGAVAVFSAPAAAQTPCYPPSPGCFVTTSSTPAAGLTLTLSATTVTRGQTIQATLSGLRPDSSGIFTILSVEQQIGSFRASASGVGSANVTIPANIELGNHTVFGKGIAADGSIGSASRGVVVVAGTGGASGGGGRGGVGGTSGGNLARTGAVVVPVALVGLGLVAGGAALKRSSRRGKASTQT